MDKFLYLVRQYVLATFRFLSRGGAWPDSGPRSVGAHVAVLAGTPLNPTELKIPDGMRYHVLDVYVDELDRADAERGERGRAPLGELLKPVRELEKDSPSRQVRERAREVLEDERLKRWNEPEEEEEEGSGSEGGGEAEDREEEGEEEWGGIED